MRLYRSNRSERLVDELAAVVRRPLADPLTPECIVVQSQGMERWLGMALSARLGVWANARFPFPRHLIERAFDSVLGDAPEHSAPFSQRAMMWTIAALLPNKVAEPGFEPLAHYLEEDPLGTQRIALSQRIARVFDDYTVYRPEMLLGWQQGEEQSWEAKLWRELCKRHGHAHQSARAKRFIDALRRGTFERAVLPQRLCLFGISSLPPLYVSVLGELSKHVETHLFMLSPASGYFGDLHRPKRSPRSSIDDSPSDEGHPLLASLGRLGREFQELLLERTEDLDDIDGLYLDPGTDCLLNTLQSDILNLRSRGHAAMSIARRPIATDDHSIEIHICHSPTREIEVLHDQLVALLEDPQLQPHDIVVMAPDIELYAPVIEAVFGQHGRPQIPYSLADRKTRTSHAVVDALYALLQSFVGRMTQSAVLDLLSFDCVLRRFDIANEEVETLRSWVEESGVRFCVDEQHRSEVGQPALRENTWRFGLDRLLLGYAMQGAGRTLYAGVLPYDDIEGSSADLLGRFSSLCAMLFQHRQALTAPRPLAAWQADVLSMLHDLLDPGPDRAHELQLVESALGLLCDSAQAAGFHDPIDRASLMTQLMAALEEHVPARGLLAKGVTFCQLVPMRSIPFEVVCLIGMNDDAFPGQTVALGFDRMADERKLGDRSRRDDDRYMFLEALLSARRRFIVSYVGRGVSDNRVMAPSVVVGELLDCITQGFEAPTRAHDDAPPQALAAQRASAVRAQVCVEHRLHAFSPHYFGFASDTRLFSYAASYCDGARAIGAARHDVPLLSSRLPAPPAAQEVDIEELISWVTVPIRSFVQRSLGIHLGKEESPTDDREPLYLDALARWQLCTRWLQLLLDGVSKDELLAIARAEGVLPLGTVGELTCQELMPQVLSLAAAANAERQGPRLPPLPIALELDGVTLSGTLHGLWPQAHQLATYSQVGKRFELEHFIRHLVLNCALEREPRADYPRRSVVIARHAKDEVARVQFAPVEDATSVLCTLLGCMREAQRGPLPFEYDFSHHYAIARQPPQGSDRAAALATTAKLFAEKSHSRFDPYLELFYPSFMALIEDEGPFGFTALAETIFGPLIRTRSLL